MKKKFFSFFPAADFLQGKAYIFFGMSSFYNVSEMILSGVLAPFL